MKIKANTWSSDYLTGIVQSDLPSPHLIITTVVRCPNVIHYTHLKIRKMRLKIVLKIFVREHVFVTSPLRC